MPAIGPMPKRRDFKKLQVLLYAMLANVTIAQTIMLSFLLCSFLYLDKSIKKKKKLPELLYPDSRENMRISSQKL